MWYMTLWNSPWPPLQWGVVVSASLVAAVTDARTRKIPNRLVWPLMACGLAWSITVGSMSGAADALVGCVVMAMPFVALFLFAGGGAGDAKLMGALGTWLGVVNALVALTSVALSGVAFGLVVAATQKRLREVLKNSNQLLWMLFLIRNRDTEEGGPGQTSDTRTAYTIPYAVAVFAGVCVAGAGVLAWRAWL